MVRVYCLFILLPGAYSVFVPEGGHHVFTCSRKDWFFCRWEYNGAVCETAPDIGSAPSCDKIRGASWQVGGGCDLKVENITKELQGKWRATIIINGDGEEKIAEHCDEEISLFTPGFIAISKLPYSLTVNKAQAVQCSTNSVQPVPSIFATVKVNDSTRYIDEALNNSSTNLVKIFQFIPQIQDGGNIEISCIVKQSIDGAVVYTDLASAVSKVVFPPQPQTGLEVEAVLNRTLHMSLLISCYPLPSLQGISWHFVGVNSSDSFQVLVDDLSRDYIILVSPVSDRTVNISLIIRSVTKEDLDFFQYLRVVNIAGDQDYNILLTQKSVSNLVPGVNTVGYVLLSVSLIFIFLLVILAGVLLNAKATGKWCFSNSVQIVEIVEERIPLQDKPGEGLDRNGIQVEQVGTGVKGENKEEKEKRGRQIKREKISVTSRESTYPVM